MISKIATLAASILAVSTSAFGAVLAKYDFTGEAGTQTSTVADSIAATVTVSGITRGSGITGNAGANSMNSNSWNTTSLDTTAYYEVTITPTSGNKLNVDAIRFGSQRSSTGPATAELRSSLNNYGTSLGSFTPPTSAADQSFALGAAFDGLTSGVTFRLFGYAASMSAGTFRLTNGSFGGFTIEGTTELAQQPNVAPLITLSASTVTVDVSGIGLEGFSGANAVTISASDTDGTIASLAATSIPAAISDNLTITGGATGPLTVSGAGFTYADIGSHVVQFTAADDDGGTTVRSLTINVVPEPTTLGVLAGGITLLGRRRRST